MTIYHFNRTKTDANAGNVGPRRLASQRMVSAIVLLIVGWVACNVGYAQTTDLAFDDIEMNDSGGMVLTADNGYQIVVTGGTSLNAGTGKVSLTAPANFTLEAQGFKIERIEFTNIDDMDDSAPRDSFIASVPGTWADETNLQVATNSDGLEIFTLDPGVPVSWDADRRDRLREVPGVGDILINTSGGQNPRKEAASFRPVPTVERFSIYYDDIDGSRGAAMGFLLKPIPEEGVGPLTVAVVDDVPPTLSGPDGFGGTATNSAMFNVVDDGHDPNAAAMTVTSNEPLAELGLSGPDAERFTIDLDGHLTFNASPSYAGPTDADQDNRYHVHIESVDQAGNATRVDATIAVAPEGGLSATDTTSPTVTSEGTSPSDAEGTYTHTEASLVPIDQFQADEPVTWSLSGTDESLFEIDASGVLRFREAPLHAAPQDQNGDNTYDLTVVGEDASGNATAKTIHVSVQETTPTLTGPDGPGRLTVGTEFKQTLPEENYVIEGGSRVDGDASTFNPDNRFDPVKGRNYAGKITSDVPVGGWAVVDTSSPDGDRFDVTSSGLVFFDHDGDASSDPPDYESPNDANGDNVYEALFEATDDEGDSLVGPDGTPITAGFTLTIQDVVEGVLPGSEATQAQYGDRDGDGVPDAFDPSPDEYDPQGFFYCADDGRIVPGGGIVVENGSGGTNSDVGTANDIRIVRDGSDGEFQWFAQKEDTYAVEYVPPPGTTLVETENEGRLDVTNLLPDNPAFIGSEEDGAGGVLVDFTPAANAYYDEFVIEAGDPHVFGNNVALTDCAITHSVVVVQDGREGAAGQEGDVVFEIVADDPAEADQVFAYTLDGTAEPGVDVDADATGTVTLPEGESRVRISVPVLDDDRIEGDETVVLNVLRYDEGGDVTSFTPALVATATVRDAPEEEVVEDVIPSVVVVQDGREGAAGQEGDVVFEIVADDPAEADQVFAYTLDGTAEPGVDVDADATGTVTLPEGESRVRISVPVLDDDRIEGDETVVLNVLRHVEGGDAIPFTPAVVATATVRDDDTAEIRVTPHDLYAMEGQDDHGVLGFRLEGVPTRDVVITLEGDDQCAVVPSEVVFTPTAFTEERLANVVAINDDVREGPHDCQPTATVTSKDPNFDGLNVDLPVVELGDGLVDQVRDPLGDVLHERLRAETEHQNDLFLGVAREARRALLRTESDPIGACRSALAWRSTARPVVFRPGSDVIETPSEATVRSWVDTLLRCTSLHVEAAGITNDADASQAERDLAERRAEAVRRMLVAHDVAPERIRIGVHPGTADPHGGTPHVTLLAVKGQDAPTQGDQDPCIRDPEFRWSGYAEVGSEPLRADADASDVRYDCQTGVERSTTGRISASQVADLGLQRTLEATTRWEAWRSVDELRGYAAHVRTSRSTISAQAEGDMGGTAVHAGVYGARRFDPGLSVDYFAFAGVGRTTFDTRWARSGDTIAAAGGHVSATLHGGLAASNTIRSGAWSLIPRAGVSFSRAMATDARFEASQDRMSEVGTVEVADVNLVRGFVEPTLVLEPSRANAEDRGESPEQRLELAPHVRCDGASQTDGIACGYGADLTYERQGDHEDDGIGLTVSYDRSDAFVRTSLEFHHRVAVHGERGTFETRLGASADGAARLSTRLDWTY
ncbi:MAG: Calx-beta domain-containing protein [Trueperaceae bacterium]|nr:Calx-beta domain-containing protein [Trueperaceae bacterium]